MNARKIVKKFITLIVVASLFSCISSVTVSADTTPRINQYYLAEGVGHVDYFVTDSAMGYLNLINQAAYNWVYTGYGWNPIYSYRTTNFNASNMDIYAGTKEDYLRENWRIAMTQFIDVRTTGHLNMGNNPIAPWDYGEITLCNYFMNSFYYSDTRLGIITHEMGHVFGLNDWTSHDSVMYFTTYDDQTIPTRPTLTDNNGINAMYH